MATGASGKTRLKKPASWRLPKVPAPPRYIPHPDSVVRYLRCLWCLTRVDEHIPVKYQKCPRCGHKGTTTFPLASNTIYVEPCESRRKK